MKGEKKAIEKTLIKVLAVFCIPLFEPNKALGHANAIRVLECAKDMLKEVGREDLINEAKELYRKSRNKNMFFKEK